MKNVLIDTGSASTIFKLDTVEEIGLIAEADDTVGTISGVGGSEYVFLKKIDSIELNGLQIKDFTVDIGVMDYGIEIDGIIGTDFLMKVRGVVDLDKLLFESRLKEG
ncbi:retropepsin-like aspartic protease [Desulfuribacillus alkaliarsenatis]|uniref:Peptidase A2 domain-containing protein n=1 Tax=Desulfuribacillus alkaliarsenatis TaxID=766136 RepID=A0A1E5G0I6_9FIRM|nr:retropepsin-like aspartic protease [Desulfuribacillus alkaliarsenatis]OEF95968.1 hypothetical protein BHF68_09455 [Desulfuribacillus alkaliarsenatis]